MAINSIAKVTVQSSALPDGELTWETNLYDVTGDQPDEDVARLILLYNNLMYDLVGMDVGKLGIEYSKLISKQQTEKEFDECMCCVKKALND